MDHPKPASEVIIDFGGEVGRPKLVRNPSQLLREHLREQCGRHRIKDEDRPRRTPLSTQQLLARAERAGTHIGVLCQSMHRSHGETAVAATSGSALLRSNRPVDQWGKLLGDVAAVSAMVDRPLHHGHVMNCGPRSWRPKTAQELKERTFIHCEGGTLALREFTAIRQNGRKGGYALPFIPAVIGAPVASLRCRNLRSGEVSICGPRSEDLILCLKTGPLCNMLISNPQSIYRPGKAPSMWRGVGRVAWGAPLSL